MDGGAMQNSRPGGQPTAVRPRKQRNYWADERAPSAPVAKSKANIDLQPLGAFQNSAPFHLGHDNGVLRALFMDLDVAQQASFTTILSYTSSNNRDEI
jgi:hypothetical protein